MLGVLFDVVLARSRVDSLAEDGFGDVPLTSVFGGYILSGSPFVNTPGAMVQTFFEESIKKFGRLDAPVTRGGKARSYQ